MERVIDMESQVMSRTVGAGGNVTGLFETDGVDKHVPEHVNVAVKESA
jgi:hypothetical protein